MNAYLDSQFTKATQELDLPSNIFPVSCTNLFSMSIDIVERLSPYLCDTSLEEILSECRPAAPDALLYEIKSRAPVEESRASPYSSTSDG